MELEFAAAELEGVSVVMLAEGDAELIGLTVVVAPGPVAVVAGATGNWLRNSAPLVWRAAAAAG